MWETMITLCVILLSCISYSLPTSDWIRFDNLCLETDQRILKQRKSQHNSTSFLVFFLTFNLTSHVSYKEKIIRVTEGSVEIMVTHLGADPTEASKEAADTRGVYVRFNCFWKLYKDHLLWVMDSEGGDI